MLSPKPDIFMLNVFIYATILGEYFTEIISG